MCLPARPHARIVMNTMLCPTGILGFLCVSGCRLRPRTVSNKESRHVLGTASEGVMSEKSKPQFFTSFQLNKTMPARISSGLGKSYNFFY